MKREQTVYSQRLRAVAAIFQLFLLLNVLFAATFHGHAQVDRLRPAEHRIAPGEHLVHTDGDTACPVCQFLSTGHLDFIASEAGNLSGLEVCTARMYAASIAGQPVDHEADADNKSPPEATTLPWLI